MISSIKGANFNPISNVPTAAARGSSALPAADTEKTEEPAAEVIITGFSFSNDIVRNYHIYDDWYQHTCTRILMSNFEPPKITYDPEADSVTISNDGKRAALALRETPAVKTPRTEDDIYNAEFDKKINKYSGTKTFEGSILTGLKGKMPLEDALAYMDKLSATVGGDREWCMGGWWRGSRSGAVEAAEELATKREVGLKQAEYFAANYLSGEVAENFVTTAKEHVKQETMMSMGYTKKAPRLLKPQSMK